MAETQEALYPLIKHLNIPSMEVEILKYWKEQDIFGESIRQRSDCTAFNFYEGPPSANGFPGIHHVMSRTLKDLFCRYKTLKGFRVHRKAGWDTHGLPVELQVEKKLGITKVDIGTKISIADYNKACRNDVLKFKDKWDELTEKMGYWVDLKNPYITFDNTYIESVWHILKNFHERGLLYKGYTIQPYSPAAGTGLSSHELNLPGCYKPVKDTSCVAQFKIQGKENEFFLAWTTTPWTLPANAALAVGKNIKYVKVHTLNSYTHLPIFVVLAKDRLSAYFVSEAENANFDDYHPSDKKPIPWRIVEEYTGEQLAGTRYEQLLPFVQPEGEYAQNAFQVIIGDFVTTEDGTGIVHIAPTFGADDMRVAKQNQIPAILVNGEPIVDKQGKYLPQLGPFANRFVKNYTDDPNYQSLDVDICVYLKQTNKAFKVEKYEHNYPHCWRTDKPVLYYPMESWFIKTTAFKDQLVEFNKQINWKPASVGTGRFGNWLENLVDWNLSRSRYWGIPLPVWIAFNGKQVAIGSIAELKKIGFILQEQSPELEKEIDDFQKHDANALQGDPKSLKTKAQYLEHVMRQSPNAHEVLKQWLGNGWLTKVSDLTDRQIDLHKPFIDSVVLIPDADCAEVYIREADLIDVWFDSGAMPFAQIHYPFENADQLEKVFPADFIAEGIDQTRGWFFTLHVIAVLYKNSIAFKNVIANGLLLDKNGIKMSKRLGNVIDPFETLQKYGADPTRWYMMENTPPWENLKFNLETLQETIRKYFGTLFNTYNFFALYAGLDQFTNSEPPVPMEERSELDRWILSCLHSLIQKVEHSLDDYDPTTAARDIQYFVIEQLSNWYVRLSRRRFWKGKMTTDKLAAYQTLYECLLTITQLMSPIAPFTAEWLYKKLTCSSYLDKNSVHITLFPQANPHFINHNLEQQMELAQNICSLVHAIRKKHNLRVRLPLKKLLIPMSNLQMVQALQNVQELIKSETNIREIAIVSEEDTTIIKKIKPNFKLLGPKLGAQMKLLQESLQNIPQEMIRSLEKGNSILIPLNGKTYELLPEEVEILTQDLPGWAVVSEGHLTIALDLSIDNEQVHEGIARDFVNRIQNLRKELDFNITDRISVQILFDPEWTQPLATWQQYIQNETLAQNLQLVDKLDHYHEVEINDRIAKIHISTI